MSPEPKNLHTRLLRPAHILIACEASGVIRRAFAARGWNAWSCDLKPSEDNSPMHHQGDIFEYLTSFGTGYPNSKATLPFHAMIAHPECRFLCSSGLHWLTPRYDKITRRIKYGEEKRVAERTQKTADALNFAQRLWELNIPHIALENSIGRLSIRIGKPTQIIQPYQFGHDASKATALWLKNLPKLIPTQLIPGRRVPRETFNGPNRFRWANQTDSGQNRLGPDKAGEEGKRSADRARTYPGIAEAMADQWTFYFNTLP